MRATLAVSFDFAPGRCMAPLPRAYQLAVGVAGGDHAEEEPRMAQSGSDDMLGAEMTSCWPMENGVSISGGA